MSTAKQSGSKLPSSKNGNGAPAAPPSSQQQQLTKAERAQAAETAQLRAAVQALTETEDIGTATLGDLEDQGDQLRRIRRKVDETDAHIERGNWILRGMKSWFGLRGKAPPPPSAVTAEREKQRAAKEDGRGRRRGGGGDADSKSGSSSGGGGDSTPSATGGASSQRAGGSAVTKQADKSVSRGASSNADADELLDAISGSLSRVKVQAVSIRDELQSQDGLVDDVSAGVERVRGKVDKATATAKKLAK